MKTRTSIRMRSPFILGALALTAAIAAGACGDDLPSDQTSSTTTSGPGNASSSATSSSGGGMGGGGGAGGGAPDCFMNPMTHVEIINACTDAEKVDKSPVLPLLGQDGKLPPLP